MKEFDHLLDVMHKLRNECPWDKEQSLETLRTYLVEEAYECIDAMSEYEPGSYHELVEELGDVLLQVVFQAEILSELEKRQIMPLIIEGLCQKLTRRHPHIFGDLKLEDAGQVIQNWEKIKAEEKSEKGKSGLYGNFKLFGPALASAFKIGALSSRVQFDWNNSSEVWTQLSRELVELQEANTKAQKEDELGDVLFSLVQWARHEEIDPEVALQKSCRKFLNRFRWMEQKMSQEKKDLKDLSIHEKENLWKQAKSALGSPSNS